MGAWARRSTRSSAAAPRTGTAGPAGRRDLARGDSPPCPGRAQLRRQGPAPAGAIGDGSPAAAAGRAVAPSPKLLDLEYANMRHDLPKRSPGQDSVLATGPGPERRGTRPKKVIGPQTATTSPPPTDSSGYVSGPSLGVSAGHCPFSADTPT